MKPYVICHMCNVRLKAARRRVERTDHIADRRARRFAIGTDAEGALRFQKPDVEGDHVVLLVSEQVGNDYLAHLQDAGVSYLFCGKRDVDVKVALDKIRRILGIRRLMLEGGGTFNGAVLHAGLVDEISQVVVPVVDGGRGVTTIFDIPGDPPRKAAGALRLRSYRRLPGGVSWFRYRVLGI
jgi:2,5-diamino-6-(ribosylamino)-4(3H)-pyrimidinone 5'-phosphate reductase